MHTHLTDILSDLEMNGFTNYLYISGHFKHYHRILKPWHYNGKYEMKFLKLCPINYLHIRIKYHDLALFERFLVVIRKQKKLILSADLQNDCYVIL